MPMRMPLVVLSTLTCDVCLDLVTDTLARKQKNPPLALECDISFMVDVTVSESRPVNSSSIFRASKKPVVYSGSLYMVLGLFTVEKKLASSKFRPGDTSASTSPLESL